VTQLATMMDWVATGTQGIIGAEVQPNTYPFTFTTAISNATSATATCLAMLSSTGKGLLRALD
tara:strand:- start:44 stop:232 length:189 start_codon:yes stop_codon:yes gene_type:complete